MKEIEILQKYGLATDVKSIKERLLPSGDRHFSYSNFLITWLQNKQGTNVPIPMDSVFRNTWEEIKNSDIAIICELASQNNTTIELAKMTNDIDGLKTGEIVVVLSRYDISSISPISDDICMVYANRKLHEIMSSNFEVIKNLSML